MMRIATCVWCGLVAGVGLAGAAAAATFTWSGESVSNSAWNTAGNWAGDVAPASGDDSVIAMAGSQRLVDQNQDRANPFVLNALQFQQDGDYSLTSGSPLRFSGAAAGLMQETAHAVTITLPLQLATNLAVGGAGSGRVELRGVASSSGGIAKGGDFLLALSGASANSFGGPVTVVAGTLELGKTANGAKAIPDGCALAVGEAGGGSTAVVRYAAGCGNDQIGSGRITIRTNGVLDINGATDAVGNGGTSSVDVSGDGACVGRILNSGAGGLWTLNFNVPLNFWGGGLVDSGTGIVRVNQGGITYGTSAGTGTAAVISGSLDMGGNSTFPVAVTNDPALDVELVVAASLASGGLYKSGAGTLLLTGTNVYAGSTLVRDGTLLAGADAPVLSPGAFGNSGSDINLADGMSPVGADIALGTFGVVTIGRNILLKNNNVGGTSTLGGFASGLSTFTGAITFDNPNVRNLFTAAAGGTVRFMGNIGGGHALTKVGPGTIVYAGAPKTYSGATTISNGTLEVNNDLGASFVTVATNGTLAGVGRCNAGVLVQGGGRVAPGSGGIGTLTNSTLALAAGSALEFEFTPARTNDQLVVTASHGLSMTNGVLVYLNQAGSAAGWNRSGVYDLIRYQGAIPGGIGGLTVANPRLGFIYEFSTNGTWVRVGIAGGTGLKLTVW